MHPHFFFPSKEGKKDSKDAGSHFFFPSKDDNFFFLVVVMFHEICEEMNKQHWMSYITTLLYTVWQQDKHNLGIVWGLLANIEICLGSEFVIFRPK